MRELNLALLAGDNFRVYNYEIAKEIGVNNAILIADLITKHLYFERKENLTDDGFFYSTADNIYKTTALTRKQQTKCIKELEEFGYIETKLKGVPAKKHFKIGKEVEKLFFTKGKNQFEQKVKTSLNKKSKHSIDNTNNKTKNNIATSSVAGKDINSLIEIFQQINPTINYGNKTTRKACEDMIKLFGFEETSRMCSAVVEVQGQDYAPVATTPYQMKEKLGALKIFFQRQNKTKNIIL